ncbi:MAG: PP2C family serine/threonine-protein phosphatase [Acidobacteriota bacterium]
MTSTIANNPAVVITSIYARSDIGNVRANNEDNFIIADLISGRTCNAPRSITRTLTQQCLLLAVSDGMGGAQAGEIASALAVYGLRLEMLCQSTNQTAVDRLVKAVEKINNLIWREGQNNIGHKGMGATITAALVEGSRAYVAEVGDSRAYIIRRNKIKQITTDQSLFEALVKSGVYNREQRENAPARNIILQSLGGQAEVQVAVNTVQLLAGDYLLLCSDGLSNKLNAEEIRKFITKSPNLELAVTTMIDIAKKRGGEDNITVVLAKFEGNGLPQGSEQGSITKTIDVISAFDPFGEEENDRNTKQMVSDNTEQTSESLLFNSTIGIMPLSALPAYPKRNEIVEASDQSIKILNSASPQLQLVIEQIQSLDIWLQQQGRSEPSLQKAIVHLEHAIKNVRKIESVARKARNVIERLTNNKSKENSLA